MRADETSNTLERVTCGVECGGNCGGNERSRPEARRGASYDPERGGIGFHHVVAARSVNVDVHETRDNGHSGRADFTGSCMDADRAAASHGGNAAILDDDYAIGDVFKWGQNAVSENGCARHGRGKWYLKPHRKS